MNKNMFINLSNHPSSCWCEKQLTAAQVYGDIVDIAFPNIDSDTPADAISALADQYAERIMQYNATAVHVMGEMTFTYALVRRLRSKGITCLASTTQRIKQQQADGSFISEFRFQTFRPYE